MSTVAQCENNACAATEQAYVRPEVDIYETPTAYVVEAELPGVNKAGLTLTVENNELTIEGRRGVEAPQAQRLYSESRAANYRRTFKLDPTIDASKIAAGLEQGLLTLTLPKAEKAKPRSIAVN